MRSEDGFCHGAGLEQAETEQDGVAHDAPNGVDGIPGNRHALDQHCINCHADEDEKALKAQCEQAFQVVLPHVALLVVAEGCHGDGRKAHHAIYLNHSSVDDDENHDAPLDVFGIINIGRCQFHQMTNAPADEITVALPITILSIGRTEDLCVSCPDRGLFRHYQAIRQ